MSNKNQIVYDSSYIITDNVIGKRLFYYNGLKYQSLLIKEEMCGRRLCEFFLTKRIGFTIHKNKKKGR